MNNIISPYQLWLFVRLKIFLQKPFFFNLYSCIIHTYAVTSKLKPIAVSAAADVITKRQKTWPAYAKVYVEKKRSLIFIQLALKQSFLISMNNLNFLL